MKKSKLLATLCLLMAVVFVFTSCGDSEHSSNSDIDGDYYSESDGGGFEDDTTNSDIGGDGDYGQQYSINDMLYNGGDTDGFVNGYALIDVEELTYIVNTRGEITGSFDFTNNEFKVDLLVDEYNNVVIGPDGVALDLGLDEKTYPIEILNNGNIVLYRLEQTIDGVITSIAVVDKSGKIVMDFVEFDSYMDWQPRELTAYDYNEGMIYLHCWSKRDHWGVTTVANFAINTKTGKIFELGSEYGNYITPFKNGQATFFEIAEDDNYKVYSISTDFETKDTGKYLESRYIKVNQIEDDICFIESENILCDSSFNIIADFSDETLGTFEDYYDGVIVVRKKNSVGATFLRLLDKKLKDICDPIEIADSEGVFSDGLLGYRAPDGNIEYVDKSGVVCVTFEGHDDDVEVKNYGDGYVVVDKNFYDKNGDPAF